MKLRGRRKKSRLQLLHQYYRYTGFYRFIWITLRNTIPPIIGIILAIIIFDRFVIDLKILLENAPDNLSAFLIYTVFFLSESFLGLIPPEAFIAWAAQTIHPWVTLTGLALLAYMGGSVSYFIGKLILAIPSVTRYTKFTMAKHIANMRKWGALLIVFAAFFPLPFSMASMAAGIMEYDYRKYLFWALSRIVRFFLYALVLFKVI